jgi:hypothetical protein
MVVLPDGVLVVCHITKDPILCVAEPPKLLGPYAPALVSKTSDSYACAPDNLTGSV